jgi:hypothetical protein
MFKIKEAFKSCLFIKARQLQNFGSFILAIPQKYFEIVYHDQQLFAIACCKLWICRKKKYGMNSLRFLNVNMCVVTCTLDRREATPIFETGHHIQ